MKNKELFELTNPQKSIWYTEQFYEGTTVNNICVSGTLYGKINEDILSRAFITKFNFIDFFLFIYALLYFANFIFFSFGNFIFMRILSKINFSPIQNIMNFKKFIKAVDSNRNGVTL